MKRILSMLLLLGMLLSVVSCARMLPPIETESDTTAHLTEEISEETTAEETEEVTETETVETEAPYPPEYPKYGNVVKILFWEDAETNEFQAGEGFDISALSEGGLWERNYRTQEILGVDFHFIGERGNYSNMNSFVSVVEKDILSGKRKYDIIASYSRTMGILASKGYLADLNDISSSYLELDRPWWHPNPKESLAIGDSLYYVTGDLSTNMLFFMHGVFVNTDLRKELAVEDPLALTLDGKWTTEKMLQLAQSAYADLDGDGAVSEADRHGLSGYHTIISPAFIYGAGLTVLNAKEDQGFVLSEDLTSPKFAEIVTQIHEGITSESSWFWFPDRFVRHSDSFKTGNTLFLAERLYQGETRFKMVEHEFAFLPIPKFDEAQNGYYTTIGNPMTLWGVISNAESEMQEECTAVMECLAYYGYLYATPVVYELTLQGRDYTEDTPQKQIFHMIRDGVRYDQGRIYRAVLGTDIDGLIAESMYRGTPWETVYAEHKETIEEQLRAMNETFRALKEQTE